MPSKPTGDWRESALWQMIEKSNHPDASPVRTTLEACLPGVQRILRSGVPQKDFTLHDENHSFRVAERMVETISSDVAPSLAARELGLLLLSAYLHDIGMSPDQRLVDRHYSYLLTSPSLLSDDECRKFREWLDEDGAGNDFPLENRPPTPAHLLKSRELVSYYCRHRHNDWSAGYIRKTMETIRPGLYPGWTEDLVLLCRSHHQGLEELRNAQLDARDVASPTAVIHLRYLACVLRVADVVEIDPERTPEVVMQHRDVVNASVPYWHKDQQLVVRVDKRQIYLTGRPTSAAYYRAIEETADQIEAELRTCQTLADNGLLGHRQRAESWVPTWDLVASVKRDIRPASTAGDEYEYINGAIRPDNKRLIEILSGTDLYESPLAAVRELVQNAFDAVRVQMAHERLGWRDRDPLDRELIKHLESSHEVELKLEMRTDGLWLTCFDTGVGMSKNDIEKRLLVSGRQAGSEVKSLERRCQEAGFRLNRTGQFGIGFLSYFMIADFVTVQTRRSLESGFSEDTGWLFSTGGVGTFGELRKDRTSRKGTKLSLRLLDGRISAESPETAKSIHAYLFQTILRCPCEFRFTATTNPEYSFRRRAGWMKQEAELTSDLMALVDRELAERHPSASEPGGLVPSLARKAFEKTLAFRDDLQGRLKWSFTEGDLPDSYGSYRIQVPYFALDHGPSLTYLHLLTEGSHFRLAPVGRGHFLIPEGRTRIGWRGLLGSDAEKSHRSYSIDIDLCSVEVAQTAASRSRLRLTSKGSDLVRWCSREAKRLQSEFLRLNHDDVSFPVSSRGVSFPPQNEVSTYWLAETEQGELLRWKPIGFPRIGSATGLAEFRQFHYCGKPVQAPLMLREGRTIDEIAWHPRWLAPDRVVLDSIGSLVPLWLRAPQTCPPRHPAGLLTEYAPNWAKLIGCRFGRYSGSGENAFLLKKTHPLVCAVDQSSWSRCVQEYDHILSLSPLERCEVLLSSRALAASWLLINLGSETEALWNALVEEEPKFLAQLWRNLFGDGNVDEIVFAYDTGLSLKVSVVRPDGWSVVSKGQEIGIYLPEPPPEWRIEIKPR